LEVDSKLAPFSQYSFKKAISTSVQDSARDICGWRVDHVKKINEIHGPLFNFCYRMASDQNFIPIRLRKYVLGARNITASKGSDDIRPLAVGMLFKNLVEGALSTEYGPAFTNMLVPNQFSVGVSGGIEKMIFALRSYLLSDDDLVLVDADQSMAYQRPNHIDVARAIQEAGPALNGLHAWMNITLRNEVVLIVPGYPDIKITDGFIQGGRLSSKLYDLTMHFILKNLAKTDKSSLALGYADDTMFICKSEKVNSISTDFERDLTKANAVLNTKKTKINKKIDKNEYTFDDNPLILGTELWPEKSNKNPFQELFTSMERCVNLNDPMIALGLIRIIYNSSANYWCRINPPEVMTPHIAELDTKMKDCLSQILHCSSISENSWNLMRSRMGLQLVNYNITAKAAYTAATVSSFEFMKTYLPEFADAVNSESFKKSTHGKAFIGAQNYYQQSIKQNPDIDLTPNVAKLQSKLAGLELEKWNDDVLTSGDDAFRALKLSCSLKGANSWINVFPTCREFNVEPNIFRLALKRRLGIPLIPPNLICGSCIKKNAENYLDEQFSVLDLNHVYTCKSSLNTKLLQERHSAIIRIFAQIATDAHEFIKLEQPIFPDNRNERMDIIIRDHEQGKLAIDVSVTHVKQNGVQLKYAALNAFSAGLKKKNRKCDHYAARCNQNGYNFIAAIFEDTGAIDPKLNTEILPKLCSGIRSETSFNYIDDKINPLSFYRACLSIAILRYDGIRISSFLNEAISSNKIKNIELDLDCD
jgi:hypothetical protein